MHLVQLLSRGSSRALLVGALGALVAAGALGWRAPRPAPALTATAPARPPVVEASARVRPRPVTAKLRRPIEAVLVERDDVIPGCGTFLFETTMVFHPVRSTGGGDLRVRVPCAEMPRPMYSAGAGNAGILRRHHRYLLWLEVATDVPDGKNDHVWRAIRIDEG
jgi:hypothetical protein